MDAIRYLVEEKGEKKIYDVDLYNDSGDVHYLIQRLAEVPEGEEVILQFTKKGIRGFIEVIRLNDVSRVEVPTINQDEDENNSGDFEEELKAAGELPLKE